MTAKAILFTTPTCAPCKAMKPVIKEMAEASGTPLETYEVGPQSSFIAVFEIRSVPTLVLVDAQDKEIKRLVGSQPRWAIEEFFS